MKSHFCAPFAALLLMFAVLLFASASAFAQTPATGSPSTRADGKDALKTTETKKADQGVKRSETATKIGETYAVRSKTPTPNPPVRSRSELLAAEPALLNTRSEMSPKKRAQGGTSSGWQFGFAPYLYMAGMTGTIGARGRVTNIDLSFSDVLDHFDIGLMGAFEAKKGRFVSTTDMMWIKLEEERLTPGGLYSSAKLGVNMFIFDPQLGYRLYDGKAGSFDLLGGVRVQSVETNLDFRAGTLPAFDVSQRKTWGTPVIGARGLLNLSPRFFLSTKFDAGGGVGADFTGQFYGGAGFRITPRVALIGGYRYLRTEYDGDSGFIFDTTMSGLLLGAKFSF
jgi:hypothetical protein